MVGSGLPPHALPGAHVNAIAEDQMAHFRPLASRWPGKCAKCGARHEAGDPIYWSRYFGVFCPTCYDPSLPRPTPPPQEEPVTEQSSPSPTPSVTAPTPEETRWASFVMNEQRYKRSVSPEDRKRAGEIMQRARRASGKVGGGGRKKASPLVVAKALKDLDAKVAEAQGINASREGEAVTVPTQPVPEWKAEPLTPAPEPEIDGPEPPPPPPPPSRADPEQAFRDASDRVLEQIDVDLVRLKTARDNAAALVQTYDQRFAALSRRHDAIIDALRALDDRGAGEEPRDA